MKKISLLLLTATLFYTTQSVTLSPNEKAGVWLGIGAATAVVKHSPLSKKMDGLSKHLNTETDDMLSWFAVAALLKGGSYFVRNNHLKNQLSKLPIILIISKLIATSRWYNKLINHIPLINSFFGCSDKYCDGICNKCKLKKGHSVGLISIALLFLDRNSFNLDSRFK